jgi:hypothetical protein
MNTADKVAIHDLRINLQCIKEDLKTTDSGRTKIESSMHAILLRLRSWDFRTRLKNSSDCSLKVAYNIQYV